MSNRVFSKLKKLNLRTVYFNFRYFPFRTAVKLPVFISANSKLLRCRGKIIIKSPVKTGMIELGYGHVGNFDKRDSRFVWDVSGVVEFERNASIGHGCKIRVLPAGKIFFGENFVATAESSFVSNKEIRIGKDCLFSWEILVMDTDFHPVFDAAGNITNPDEAIHIDDKVWVGCRVLILKSAYIPRNSIIAAGAIITKKLSGENQVFAGNPAVPVKQDISWRL